MRQVNLVRFHGERCCVLAALGEAVPEGGVGFDEDTLTDRPTSFFVREYIREQVLLAMRGEIPHAVAVSIDEFVEGEQTASIKATIHVEKVGQRKILIGTGGLQIKEIRVGAQARIRELELNVPKVQGLYEAARRNG